MAINRNFFIAGDQVPAREIHEAEIYQTRRGILKAIASGLAFAGLIETGVVGSNVGHIRDRGIIALLTNESQGELGVESDSDGEGAESSEDFESIQPSDSYLYPVMPQEVQWYQKTENEKQAKDILVVGIIEAWRDGLIDIPSVDDNGSVEQLHLWATTMADSMLTRSRQLDSDSSGKTLWGTKSNELTDSIAYSPSDVFLLLSDEIANGNPTKFTVVKNSYNLTDGTIKYWDEQSKRKMARKGVPVQDLLPKIREGEDSFTVAPGTLATGAIGVGEYGYNRFTNRWRKRHISRYLKQQGPAISRRDFLKLFGATTFGALLSGLGLSKFATSKVAGVYEKMFALIGADNDLVEDEVVRLGGRLRTRIDQAYERYKGVDTKSSLHVYARGEILTNDELLYEKEDESYVGIDSLPSGFIEALTLLEDKRLYGYITRSGVDPEAFFNAAVYELKGENRGGSGLLQQIIKNTMYTPEEFINQRGPVQKSAEIQLAMKAQRYIKSLILTDNPGIDEEDLKKEMVKFIQEMYVNNVQFGPGIIGLKDASKYFWGIEDVSQLNSLQYLVMASQPNRPSVLTVESQVYEYVKRAVFVQNYLRKCIIDSESGTEPLLTYEVKRLVDVTLPAFPVVLRSPEDDWRDVGSNQLPGAEPFLDYISQVTSALLGQPGAHEVFTTLDMPMQEMITDKADAYAEKYLEKFGVRPKIDIIVRGPDGEILAYYGEPTLDTSLGSIVKPFITAQALAECKISVGDTFYDGPVEIEIHDGGVKLPDGRTVLPDGRVWTVNNYGPDLGKTGLGPALAQSSNSVAAQIALLIGAGGVRHAYERFGLVPYDETLDYGVMDVLGVTSSNCMRVAMAYAALCDDGRIEASSPIVDIYDEIAGERTYHRKPRIQQAVSPYVARTITQILSNDSNIPNSGGWQVLRGPSNGEPFFTKTGTPDSQEAVWCAGATLADHNTSGGTSGNGDGDDDSVDKERPITVVVRCRFGSDKDIKTVNPTGLKDAVPLYRQVLDAITSRSTNK